MTFIVRTWGRRQLYTDDGVLFLISKKKLQYYSNLRCSRIFLIKSPPVVKVKAIRVHSFEIPVVPNNIFEKYFFSMSLYRKTRYACVFWSLDVSSICMNIVNVPIE